MALALPVSDVAGEAVDGGCAEGRCALPGARA